MAPRFILPSELRKDDLDIPNETRLWRRADADSVRTRPDGSEIVSDSQFLTHELSTRKADSKPLADFLAEEPGSVAAEFTVGFARSKDMIVAKDPADPNHILLYRKDNPGQRLKESQAVALSRNAIVLRA